MTARTAWTAQTRHPSRASVLLIQELVDLKPLEPAPAFHTPELRLEALIGSREHVDVNRLAGRELHVSVQAATDMDVTDEREQIHHEEY